MYTIFVMAENSCLFTIFTYKKKGVSKVVKFKSFKSMQCYYNFPSAETKNIDISNVTLSNIDSQTKYDIFTGI